MADVSVTFNADTGQYVASVEGMDKATAKAAEAVAKAKNVIVAANGEQVRSAIAAGKSSDQIAALQERNARRIGDVTEANANRVVAAYERMQAQAKRTAEAMNSLPKVPQVPQGDHNEGVSNRQASSAFLRGGGLRADEAFLTTIPGAAKAVQALFPLIGGAGLAGLLFEMGEKGYEAFEKVRHAGENTRQAFADLHDKSQIFIDDKELENQKIQDQIDKITGHPNNGLATALLEAKKNADQLLASLQDDRKQLEAIFKQQDTGVLGKALSALGFGPTSTGQQEGELSQDYKNLQKKIEGAKGTYTDSMSKATDDAGREKATKDYNKSVHDAFQERIDSYKSEYKRLVDAEAAVHTTATRNGVIKTHEVHSQEKANIDGVIDLLQRRQQDESLNESIYSGSKTLGQDKQNHELGAGADKAAEAKLRAIETQFAEMNSKLPEASAKFWHSYLGTFTEGSSEYLRVVEQFNKYTNEFQKGLTRSSKLQEQISKLKHESDATANLSSKDADEGISRINTLLREQAEDVLRTGDRWRAYNAEVAKTAAMVKAAATAMQEAQLNRSVATGATSPADAAQQLVGLHQETYSAHLTELQQQLAEVKEDIAKLAFEPDGPEKEKKVPELTARAAGLQGQIVQTEGQANLTAYLDQIHAFQETALGGAISALQEFAAANRDTSAQLRSLVTEGLNSFNKVLLDAATGQYKRGEIKDQGRQLATSVAGAALKHGEASLMGALGLGKLGTRSNPIYTLPASGAIPGMAGSDPLSAIPSTFKSMMQSMSSPTVSVASSAAGAATGAVANAATSPAGSGFFSWLFGGGKALGGDVTPGYSYDVGEMGREKFVPTVPGVIIPHTSLGDGATNHLNLNGGDTHHHHWNIDAKGSHNPAETEAACHRAITKAMPHIVSTTARSIQAHRERLPPSHRQ